MHEAKTLEVFVEQAQHQRSSEWGNIRKIMESRFEQKLISV